MPDLQHLPPAGSAAVGAQSVKSQVIPELVGRYPDKVIELPESSDMPQIQVSPETFRAVAENLRDKGFNLCIDVTGADYLPRKPRFEAVYHLLAFPSLMRLRVRVPLDEDKPEVPTVSDLWESANPAEREVWDMFGIVFAGHPNLTRILNPDDWIGYPLRKDYPLRGLRDDSAAPPAEHSPFAPIRFDKPITAKK